MVRRVKGSELERGMVLLGSQGGYTAIIHAYAKGLGEGTRQLVTEHGMLLIDQAQQYTVMDAEDVNDYAIPTGWEGTD